MQSFSLRSGRQLFVFAGNLIVAVARFRGLDAQSSLFPGFRAVALHPGLYARRPHSRAKERNVRFVNNFGNDETCLLRACLEVQMAIFAPVEATCL